MLRRAPSSLASAISAFAHGRHRIARELLDAHQGAPSGAAAHPPPAPRAPELLLSDRLRYNLAGVLAHHAGDHEAAARELASALRVAEAQSRSGLGHDAYVDLAGVLIDTAVNDLARGETERARTSLKRARYMAERAHRPDARLVAMCDAIAAELALSTGDQLGALRCSIDASTQLQHAAAQLSAGGAGAALGSATVSAVGASVRASVACVRARCLRVNGLHAEAVGTAAAALSEFDAHAERARALGAPAAADGAAEAEPPALRPLPLVHARLLTAHALALRAADAHAADADAHAADADADASVGAAPSALGGRSALDVALALQHARLLLEGEAGQAHAHARIAASNARAHARELSRAAPGAAPAARPAARARRRPLLDLPLLPPALGLADTDPTDLAWRPVGLGGGRAR